MARQVAGRDRKRGDPAAWALLLVIPAAVLCCGGPLAVAALGAVLGAAAAWIRGEGGLALLGAAALVWVFWRVRRGARVARARPHALEGAAPGGRRE